jgi:endonuclease/exonuclease/phosphatase family metal-dependent hydrolase
VSYKIGSFNCLSFGSGKIDKARKIAEIIATERFDIVALQEVKNSYALGYLLDALNKYGGKWQGDCDERGSADYAFVWNTKRVRLVRVKNRYGERTVFPHTVTAKGAGALARAPYCARFEPSELGIPKCEIRVINTHIRFGRQKSDSALAEQGLVALRKAEYTLLTQTIYPTIAGKSIIDNMPTADCRPIYTIMLGDYNLNKLASGAGSPYLQDSFTYGMGGRKKEIVTEQTELTTLKQPSGESAEGEVPRTCGNIYANNYDHITFDKYRFEGIGVSFGRIDAVRKYSDNDPERYREEISDHTPIFLSLELKRR